MQRLLYLLLILPIGFASYSQSSLKDSIMYALDSKPKLYAGFHNRNTFVNTSKVKLYGVVAGLDFNDKLKVFAGYYFFNSSQRERILYSTDFAFDTVYKDNRMNYFSLGSEYVFFRKGRISTSWPSQIGVGKLRSSYSIIDSILVQKDHLIIPIESGVNGYYDILNWLVLKAGVGYRISIGNRDAFELSSPYYNLGLTIKIGNLYDELQLLME